MFAIDTAADSNAWGVFLIAESYLVGSLDFISLLSLNLESYYYYVILSLQSAKISSISEFLKSLDLTPHFGYEDYLAIDLEVATTMPARSWFKFSAS